MTDDNSTIQELEVYKGKTGSDYPAILEGCLWCFFLS